MQQGRGTGIVQVELFASGDNQAGRGRGRSMLWHEGCPDLLRRQAFLRLRQEARSDRAWKTTRARAAPSVASVRSHRTQGPGIIYSPQSVRVPGRRLRDGAGLRVVLESDRSSSS